MAAEVSRSLQKLPIWLMTPCTKSKENDFLEWKQSFFYYDGKWIKPFLKHVNEAWFYGRNPHLALLIADAVTSLFSIDPVIALRAACEGEQLEVVNCGNCRNEFLRLRFPNCYAMWNLRFSKATRGIMLKDSEFKIKLIMFWVYVMNSYKKVKVDAGPVSIWSIVKVVWPYLVNCKTKMEEDNPEYHVHKGYRLKCEACGYHCSICGNRAMDETRMKFINYRELYENGGTCTYECIPSELKNNHACYHCGRYVPENEPFCVDNCFRDHFNNFWIVCEMWNKWF